MDKLIAGTRGFVLGLFGTIGGLLATYLILRAIFGS